ncbi:MAG: aminoacyl-tRNA hydrolase [Gammaproteobacteria bacterium]|nr:aminoacyl-tRNA hydrolase [Gammaproteobacteria bacterium]MDE0444492.1 aminoacyl-tRNA hydrolase [Gammaproteobacteria bacterium]
MAIRLIAGLGNPGARYARTRHNIGAAWLESLARRFGIPLAEDRKSKGALGRGDMLGRDVRLLLPTTYVNLSGDAVSAVTRFHKIAPAEMLIAYDEVAFPVGRCRLKDGGGHNGHNGLKSVIAALGNDRSFARLRIGIGHPGNADEMVAYLTRAAMPPADREAATQAAWLSDEVLDLVLEGDLQQAMNLFHAPDRTE